MILTSLLCVINAAAAINCIYLFMQRILKSVRYPLLLMLIISGFVAVKADAQQTHDVDNMFEKAREYAALGEYSEARSFALQILDVTPQYHDVRVFLARTLGWDHRFSEARSQLRYVLRDEPENIEALSARADIELWDRNYRAGIEFADRAIEKDPQRADLYIRRARLFIGIDRFSDASSDLDRAVVIDPENLTLVRQIRSEIEQDQQRNIIAFGFSYDHFDSDLDPWQRYYGEYHRLTDYGPVIGRASLGQRFETTDWQAELDVYPTLGRNWYAYLNAAVSGGNLFPDFRIGGELYRSLPTAFEGSAGVRYLNFSDDDVVIFTGSISKYWRSWFFTLRPFYTPQDAGRSIALNTIARRYLGNPQTYISLNGGFGFSPDESRLLDGDPNRRLLNSRYIGLNGYHLLRERLQLFGEIKFTEQQFPFSEDYIQIYTLETGIRYRF